MPDALKSAPGTYALILHSHSRERVQVGRWRGIELQPGYSIYVGSAFGPGGVQARVSRHLRVEKPQRWHIDYVTSLVTPLAAWVSYASEKLEHRWAQFFFEKNKLTSVPGFGCSDCKCHSHLFHVDLFPDISWLEKMDSLYLYRFR